MTTGRLIEILSAFDSDTPICVDGENSCEYDIDLVRANLTFTMGGDDTEFVSLIPDYGRIIKF